MSTTDTKPDYELIAKELCSYAKKLRVTLMERLVVCDYRSKTSGYVHEIAVNLSVMELYTGLAYNGQNPCENLQKSEKEWRKVDVATIKKCGRKTKLDSESNINRVKNKIDSWIGLIEGAFAYLHKTQSREE